MTLREGTFIFVLQSYCSLGILQLAKASDGDARMHGEPFSVFALSCQIAELERSKTEQATLCGLFSCFHFSELCKQRELERKVRGMKLQTESRGVCEILIDFARNGRQKVCVFEIF